MSNFMLGLVSGLMLAASLAAFALAVYVAWVDSEKKLAEEEDGND